MIAREFYMERKDYVKLYRTYSTNGCYIIQHPSELKYDEAIDVSDAPWTYTETTEKIPERPKRE